MSFTSPQSGAGGSAGASPHLTFGDHLLQAVGAASPTLGGLLGAAGVHQSTQPVQDVVQMPGYTAPTAPGFIPTTASSARASDAYANYSPTDFSAVGQSNARPQGGSVVGNLLAALMG